APNRVVDLPTERDRLQRPLVYHLFGKLSASPTYVISDEDLLEFICALQNEHLAPEKLFHELEHNHLLFIGSNFSNWLARP
ncbi:SIR2 family protein, partial [Vibrio parahaemolyticus]